MIKNLFQLNYLCKIYKQNKKTMINGVVATLDDFRHFVNDIATGRNNLARFTIKNGLLDLITTL